MSGKVHHEQMDKDDEDSQPGNVETGVFPSRATVVLKMKRPLSKKRVLIWGQHHRSRIQTVTVKGCAFTH